MWQQISSNKKKTIFIMFFMAMFLLGLGYIGGYLLYGVNFALDGVLIASVIWLILTLVTYFQGDNIVLAMGNAQKITHDDNPQLFNIVEEMSIAAGLPKVPDVYIIDEPAPNAFATGRNPKKAAVAVTVGLLKMLNREELQGVIAHEIAHIKNRDTLYMLFAIVMLNAIIIMANMFTRTRMRSSRQSSSKGSQVEIIIIIACYLILLLSPLIANLLYLAISRKREYLADASAALFTRYPKGLANALAKISGTTIKMKSANNLTAPMYIVNPLAFNAKENKLKDITSTHPATSKRIEILYNMAGADVVAYEKAYEQVNNQKIFSSSLLNNATTVSAIVPTPDTGNSLDAKIERARDTENMMWKLDKYIVQTCECGTKIKVPPCYKGTVITCPHCKNKLKF